MSLYFRNKGINVADDGFFKNLDEPVVVERAKIYPQAYFSPKFTINGTDILFEQGRTCIYHMFANSNVDFSKSKSLNRARQQALTFAEYRDNLAQAQRFPRLFDSDWLSTIVGVQTELGIEATAETGIVLHGPYTSLPRGSYVARVVTAVSPTRGTAEIRVVTDEGGHVLGQRVVNFPLDSDDLTVAFDICGEAATGLEAVVHIHGVDAMVVDRLEIDTREARLPAVTPARRDLKILHRIYFGFDGQPDRFPAYLKTWEEQLPDFQIMHWNASNLPMDINPWVRQLYAEKDHAFLTDYFRWHVLEEHGGTYLDADVEIIDGDIYRKLIEELEVATNYEALIGIDEKGGGWYTAHTMACKPKSDLAKFMRDLYANFGAFIAWLKKGFYFWAPQLVGLFYTTRGLNAAGMGTTPQLESPIIAANVKIYPQEWFSPLAPTGDPRAPFDLNALTDNTALCHHFACSWHDLDSIYLEHSQTQGGQANITVSEILSTVGMRFKGDDVRLSTISGRKVGSKVSTEGRDGVLLFGPYVTIRRGRYRVTFGVEDIVSLEGASVDVVGNKGKTTIVPMLPLSLIEHDGQYWIDFELESELQEAEFRLYTRAESEFSVSELVIRTQP